MTTTTTTILRPDSVRRAARRSATVRVGFEIDASLARRAADGEVRAFEELVRRHRPRLVRVAATFVTSQQDAEDLAQETLLKAHRSIGGFDGRAKVTTWLGRICERTCIDHLRRRRLTQVGLDDSAERVGSMLAAQSGAEPGSPLFELSELLGDLDHPIREAVVLIDVLGHNAATAARRVGVPPSTMRSRAGQGRRLLRLALTAESEETPSVDIALESAA